MARETMEKATICWGCQNFSKCSWSRGVPVENWEATPTEIINRNGKFVEIETSYCVHSCPQFKADTKQGATVRQIGDIVNKSMRTMFRWLADKEKTKRLRKMLKDKGYILHICKEIYDDTGNCFKTYYLERVEDESN